MKKLLSILFYTLVLSGFTITKSEAVLVTPNTNIPPVNIGLPANLDSFSTLSLWTVNAMTYNNGAPHPDYFAPYAFQPVGDYLYVAIGLGLPADGAGAEIAKYDSDYNIHHVYSPTEDGIHDIGLFDGKIYIPGTDPGYLDNQDAGNEYIIDPIDDTTVKLRYNPNSDPAGEPYLPNVIHSWGHWINPETGYLYLATGTGVGASIYKSSVPVNDPAFDQNEFTYINNLSNYHFGAYRAMDIIGFDGALFASSRAGGEPSESSMKLWKSIDDGASWEEVINVFPDVYTQFIMHNNKLIILGADYSKIYVFSDANSVETYTLNDFDIAVVDMAWVTREFAAPRAFISSGRYLYAISADNAIYRTKNFSYWEKVSTLADIPASITYWNNKNQLAVGTYGSDSTIYLVNLNSLSTASGKVFTDSNKNGVYDIGEALLSNVLVELIDPISSTVMESFTTSDNGEYFMDQLMGNNYLLRFTGISPAGSFSQTLDIDLSLNAPLETNLPIVLAATTDNPTLSPTGENLSIYIGVATSIIVIYLMKKSKAYQKEKKVISRQQGFA